MYPTSYLQPGSSNTQAVKKLQDYLVSRGKMTRAQVNTGYGTYGPRTRAGVASLQRSLGVNTSGGGVGYFGPRTIKALKPNVTKNFTPTKIAQSYTKAINTPVKPKSAPIKPKVYSATLNNSLTKNTISSTDKSYITNLQNQISGYTKSMQDAATKLSTEKTKSYTDAYNASGIDKIKNEVSTIDAKILAGRQKRDSAIANVTNNPQLSAALMTGRSRRITNAENAKINNWIQERNALSGTYNTGLAQVQTISNNATNDALNSYKALHATLSSAIQNADNYRKLLADSLKQGFSTSYRNRKLNIGLMNAQSAAIRASKYGAQQSSTKWKLATSPLTGAALYWYNSSGATKPLSTQDRNNLNTTPTTPVIPTTPVQTTVQTSPTRRDIISGRPTPKSSLFSGIGSYLGKMFGAN